MMSLIRIGLVCLTATTALLGASPASAQLRPMSEKEMSATYGQGLLDLSNSSFIYNNDTFYTTRIAIGADVLLNANFGKINFGAQYAGASPDWNQSEIDIPVLQFGRMDASAAQRLVKITNPYFEFIYRNNGNVADPASREVVGMRMGFEGIAGDVGMTINKLKGSMFIDGVEYNRDNLPQGGGVTAGDASGPSRDFWISALKTNVQFPTQAGPSAPEAQAGFWLNWRDKLTAIRSADGLTQLQAPPPNAFRR